MRILGETAWVESLEAFIVAKLSIYKKCAGKAHGKDDGVQRIHDLDD